jgi:hypothetical protein
MTHKYSLYKTDYINLEDDVNRFFTNFYADKRQVFESVDKARSFLYFEKDLRDNMKMVLHEYNMGYLEHNDVLKITAELPPELQKYVVYLTKFQCERSDSLKPGYTIQGKNAEAITTFALNNFLHFFGIKNKIKMNVKSYRYGGDGGYDLSIGKFRFDVKHRDDGPSHGLILRDRFLEMAKDDVILILVTNTTSIRLGDMFNKEMAKANFSEISEKLADQDLPMAITGWMSVKEYKEKKTPRGGAYSDGVWVVDKLNPITDLVLNIVKDQILSEGLIS